MKRQNISILTGKKPAILVIFTPRKTGIEKRHIAYPTTFGDVQAKVLLYVI